MPITINGTSGISGVDGTAGTPAVIGSDADTGFVFAAGQITASLNGSGANVPLVQGTAQNSTAGTSIDFTGIPSWAKRVTVIFNGVSTTGASDILVLHNVSGNLWLGTGLFVNNNTNISTVSSAGTISLGGPLGMVRITTSLGTPTFDAGSINIMYE